MAKRKTKQITVGLSMDEETSERMFQLALIRSKNAGRLVSKSELVRALIRDAYNLEMEKNDEN